MPCVKSNETDQVGKIISWKVCVWWLVLFETKTNDCDYIKMINDIETLFQGKSENGEQMKIG